MSNFLEKSKDLYFLNEDKYEHFYGVFSKIGELSACKNFYNADLFNIEEVLSILEMKSQLDDDSFFDAYVRYIIDVIGYYTPDIIPYGEACTPWGQSSINPLLWPQENLL